MKEINYQFRERLSRVHQPGRRDTDLTPHENELEITDRFTILIPENADDVLKNAARDLEDYFFTSMGISLRVAYAGKASAAPAISYGTDATLAENSYRLTVDHESIRLIGQTSRMAAQAGYFIEDLMNLRKAPFLELTDTVRTSLFVPRMVHAGYGLDMYPDEHLLQIAHAGISAILVFVKGVDTTPHGYHDFNDLCRRAARYGLDVYAYSYLQNKLHPEDEGAEECYEELYGHFLDRCPLFKGIVFVGESCEFPSKDPHTTGIRRLDNIGPDGKPLVTGKPSPGWWPCYDYPIFLRLFQKIAQKRRPDLDIVFWSYNWSRAPEEARRALINDLPKDVALQATYEMGEDFIRDGHKIRVADYNLFYVGPSFYFTSEAKAAHEAGLRFYSMTNTGGRTWDVGVAPYVPAPYRWIERFRGMQKAHREWGLVGTMDSHHYGFVPSPISELAKWAFYSPEADLPEILRRITVRDFGEEHADAVLAAYRLFGEAMDHMIAADCDQYGPCRIGPAYPFILFEHEDDVEIPTVPYAHFGGNAICLPVYGKGRWGKIRGLHISPEATEYFLYAKEEMKKVAELYAEGVALLEPAVAAIPEASREAAERILGVATFFRNTARTAVNMKEFFFHKERLLSLHGDERNAAVDEMLGICRRERENAIDTIPLVEADSMLGYEPSMEYIGDRAHIEWKLSLLDEVIEHELPSYYE